MTVALGILAGGQGRRMGGADKALLTLGDGRAALDHLLDRLTPWPGPVVLNANGDPARFARWDLPVVADSLTEPDGDPAGPLAGLLAVLEWVRAGHPDVSAVVTVPVDTPLVPRDLRDRLAAARADAGADIACAASGGRVHHATALWPVALAPALRTALADEGLRAVRAWTGRHRVAQAPWAVEPVDPFLSLNTPDDLDRARRLTPSPV
ncbi:molybdenum cofactor guanylyltransferase MobA [Roseospira navarrensis]|uniref:Molybdenum cofactor guanylyltransferase n=1 Tax=Roseospira navarrensis TaxID=140058 RepID=A0A7X1ZDM9_9PROT|nr:molybdenum cofactor guanylyltransferase MobA [Roseospira navarrensis]MQX36124.1 molybdenum cofactor guanylyltransferase [Roseospira navarrensis]